MRPQRRQPTGSPIPGILQARTLEWVAISFSNAWKWKLKVKSLSRVQLFMTSWTAAYQAPLSMGFPRQEYWSGVPLPSPESLPRDLHILLLYFVPSKKIHQHSSRQEIESFHRNYRKHNSPKIKLEKFVYHHNFICENLKFKALEPRFSSHEDCKLWLSGILLHISIYAAPFSHFNPYTGIQTSTVYQLYL